ncbi:potassium channel family protein [Corynebacterium uterequi]|uniref:potassium channel family protein n=1 Tax=Corynebacterium uterequi TaxID=1072256 RepID=UPI001F2F09C4|nr:TrkA family potassium uptake protein [Corynebacterium uterequi]
MAKRNKSTPVAVLGLGRFGSALAHELSSSGVEVLGVDSDPKVVQAHASSVREVACGDSTSEAVLEELGVFELPTVVVAIGQHLEDSILTASILAEREVTSIWARADNRQHERILQRIGVHHVVRPEYDTGRRVAHLLNERIHEFAEIARDYSVVAMPAPDIAVAIADPLELWQQHHVQVVSVRRRGIWQPVDIAGSIEASDVITIAGATKDLEKFSLLN